MDELKEKYIQLCCDFYNEHAPEDKIWFGRMFDDCHQEHNKRNSSMYRWQLPLKVLKDQQATISNLKTQLNNMEACYIQVKKERDGLQNKIDVASGRIRGICRFINEDNPRCVDALATTVDCELIRIEGYLRGTNDINLTR